MHQDMARVGMTGELKHKKVNFAMAGCSEMFENSHTFHQVLDFINVAKIRKINLNFKIILVDFPVQPSLFQWCADLRRNLVVKPAMPSLGMAEPRPGGL